MTKSFGIAGEKEGRKILVRLTVAVQPQGDDGENELHGAQAESYQVHDSHSEGWRLTPRANLTE